MSPPTRDVVEFAAAMILGTALGVGLTRMALSRRAGQTPDREGALLGTFLDAVRDEAGAVLDEKLGADLVSDHGGSR